MSEKQEQIALWRSHIQERKAKGLTVVEWCESQGISKGVYNYRRKVVYRADADAGFRPLPQKAKKHLRKEAVFAQMPLPALSSAGGIMIEWDGLNITISKTSDIPLAAELLKYLQKSC